MTEDLSQVKAGDKMFHENDHGLWVVTVEKVTKLHIVTTGGKKFSLRTGWDIKRSTWSSSRVRPYVEQEWRDYRKAKAENKLRQELAAYKWGELDIAIVLNIHALLPKAPEVPPSV